MKRHLIVISLLLSLVVPAFANGTREEGVAYATEEVPVRVLAFKGPTAIGMAKLMDEAKNGPVDHNTYSFQLLGAPTEAVPLIAKGAVDIASIPANLASVLYNNTDGKIKAIAVNTLGVIYVVENGDTVKSVQDLKGRTIYASGKGATPEYGFRTVLEQNGLDPDKDLTIEWKSEHAECVAALKQVDDGIALLPQPFVTVARMQNPGLNVVLDLTKEWEAKSEGSSMITSVVVVQKQFLETHPNAVSRFMESYAQSVAYMTDPANIKQAAALTGSFDIIPAKVAEQAIPHCNIVDITGKEMQAKLSSYLGELYRQNPKAVGGKVPDSSFYAL
ncbi:MAG: ABC transporter substrate-binding protein [Sphaerochaetaceae bacterium]|jgi:NitT/TauT family transport system substrate-binding protein|nr:ABC transporter substrate-binding protein [Spirochaetaceae bacterium]MDY6344052.1 ABC transporter substrate-binding protein [Sphaerochaetaceae bacterium]